MPLFTVRHVHVLDEGQVKRLREFIVSQLGHITRKVERAIMPRLEDIQDSLTKIGEQATKIATEQQSLIEKISQLEAGNPDQQALIDSIAAQAQGVAEKLQAIDDLVPDAGGGSTEPDPEQPVS